VEPALHEADRVATLVRTVRLYRNHAADARPTDAAELRRALLAAADLLGLAEELWTAGDPAGAVEALQLTEQGLPAHWLAGRIHAAAGDGPAAFRHYAEAVRLSPTQFRLRRQRLDDLWRLWSAADEAPPEWAEALLDDLAHLRRFSRAGGGPELSLQEAAVYERTGQGRALAAALHAAAQRDPGRFDILHRYAVALRGLGPEADASVEGVKTLARHRITPLLRSPRREEMLTWLQRFDEV
jgi:hypothetical protein